MSPTTWVWEHSRLKGNQRLVLLAIAHACGGEPSVVVAHGVLEQMTGTSRRTVQSAVRAAERSGDLRVVTGLGPGAHNLYTFPLPTRTPIPGVTSVRRTRVSNRLRLQVFARDGFVCVRCSATDDLTLDHIWPWILGGLNTLDNLQTLCRSCNSAKGARV